MILDNPVWRRPFIETAPDTYFSAIFGLIRHYALSLFEGLASSEASLEEKYRTRKAQYLEDELEHLLKAGFPGETFTAAVYGWMGPAIMGKTT